MPSQTVFVDTSFLVAFFSKRDQLHKAALEAHQAFAGAHFVTSEMVLDEFLSFFGGFGKDVRVYTAECVQHLRDQDNFEIVEQTHALFENAFRQYKMYADKDWSLTDCSSFVIMRQRRISLALTHDKHFSQAGFTVLLP